MLGFIEKNIYYVLFIILIFEWPVTAFMWWDYAANGDLDLVLFCIIALAGDVVWDLGLYFLWRYFNKSKLVQKYSTLNKAKTYIEKEKNLEKFLSKYAFVYFFIVKVTPYISGVWLTIPWIKKYNFRKFLLYSIVISCIAKSVYIWLWYLWGISLAKMKIFLDGWSNFVLFLILWCLLFCLIKVVSKKVVKRLEKKLKNK